MSILAQAKVQDTPTMLVGLIAFLVAAVACFLAMRRVSGTFNSRAKRFWLILSLMFMAFAAETQIQLRHSVGHVIRDMFKAGGTYEGRKDIQIILLGSACVVMLILFGLGLWRLRKSMLAEKLGFIGCLGCVGLFVVEAISLHALDRVLYFILGPIFLVALLWATGAALSTIGAMKAH